MSNNLGNSRDHENSYQYKERSNESIDNGKPVRKSETQSHVSKDEMVYDRRVTEGKDGKMGSLINEPSHEVYKTLFEYNLNAIFLLSVNGIILEANHVVSKVFGYSNEEIQGRNYQELLDPKFRDITKQHFSKTLQGTVCVYETQGVHADGETIYLQMRNVPAIASGEIVGVFGVITDITRQKQVEKSLRGSEKHYRRLVELSPVAMIVHREGLIQYANHACAKLLGASNRFELMDQPILEFSPPEYREVVKNRIKELDRTGIVIEPMEEKVIRRDGNLIDVEVTGISIRYDGKPSYLMILQDISKDRRVMQALRQSEEKYRLIAENSQDLIGVLGVNGKNIYASPSHERILGIPISEIEGHDPFRLIHPDDIEIVSRDFKKLVQSKHPTQFEFRIQRADGTYLWIETYGTPVLDENSNISHVLMVSRNISKRKEYEQMVKVEKEKLDSLCHARPLKRS